MTFVDPKALTSTVSSKISTNMTAAEFTNAVKAFYNNVYSTGIFVTKTMYSKDGNVTTNVMNASTTVFLI